MNRESSPTLDACVQDVLQEEMRLKSHQVMTEAPKAFQTSQETALLSTNNKPVQCFECRGFGHIA